MMLEVRDNENIPADLLCLHCSHADNVCFIKTVNLDGELGTTWRRKARAEDMLPSTPAASLPSPLWLRQSFVKGLLQGCCLVVRKGIQVIREAAHDMQKSFKDDTFHVYVRKRPGCMSLGRLLMT